MKFSTLPANLLVVATALVPATTAVECYNSGHSINREFMYNHAKRACTGWDGNYGAFQNSFGAAGSADEMKTACVIVDGGRINMEVWNLQSKTANIPDDHCVNLFDRAISDCLVGMGPLSYGGKEENGDWFVRIDPNEGRCGN